MKINFYKAFWFIYLIEFVIPLVLIFHYLYGYNIGFLVKTPFILYYLIIVVYHLRKMKLSTNNLISYLFLFAIIFSSFIGFIEGNSFDGKFLSHIYFTTIPILGISFGQSFAKFYDKEVHHLFLKLMNISFYITAIILLIYSYFHFITGDIPYWGLGTDLHFLIPFLLLQGRTTLVILAVFLVLLSGKRASLINIIIEFFLVYSFKLKKLSLISLPKILLYLSLIIAFIFYVESQGALSRFDATIDFDISDDENMMYATGGRWQEFLGIYDYLNAKVIRWYTGAGFGGRYIWYTPLTHYYELKHYAHFAPLSYTFIYGVPFAIIIYLLFTYYIIKSLKIILNPFVLIFTIGVFSSFFGANLFVDVKIWVCFGILIQILKNKNLFISQLKI